MIGLMIISKTFKTYEQFYDELLEIFAKRRDLDNVSQYVLQAISSQCKLWNWPKVTLIGITLPEYLDDYGEYYFKILCEVPEHFPNHTADVTFLIVHGSKEYFYANDADLTYTRQDINKQLIFKVP